jgi:nitroreductase
MLEKLIDKSRSHREFVSGEAVPREKLVKWISYANHCPAAMNLQTLKYKILIDRDEVARLLPLTRWAASLDIKLPPEGHEPTAFIVMCHDTSLSPIKQIFMIDVGICAQTIMLAAAEDGFGGCMIGSASADAVKQALGLAEHLTPVFILGLGIPEDKVVLTKAKDGKVTYYRDENNVHYVPKRTLEEIIID